MILVDEIMKWAFAAAMSAGAFGLWVCIVLFARDAWINRERRHQNAKQNLKDTEAREKAHATITKATGVRS